MNKLKIFNLKRFIFLAIGLLFYITILYILIKTNLGVTEIILYFISLFIISQLVDSLTNNFTIITIWKYIYKRKKIYHIDLGYFIICLKNEINEYNRDTLNVYCYDQKILYAKELFSIKDVDVIDLDELPNIIKKKLDLFYNDKIKLERIKYEDKVKFEKYREKLKSIENKIDEWDGCLDKQSSRDNKLNKILNN